MEEMLKGTYADPPLSFTVIVFDDLLFNDASNGFCRPLEVRTEDLLIISCEKRSG